jgi:GNAT superfamily N-acetyltransferase
VNPPPWTLRPAAADDREVLAELRAAVLRPDLERLGRYDPQRVRQQGRGLGSAVLKTQLDRTDKRNQTVALDVLQGSAARRLYERHGLAVESEDRIDVFMVRTPGARRA